MTLELYVIVGLSAGIVIQAILHGKERASLLDRLMSRDFTEYLSQKTKPQKPSKLPLDAIQL